MVFGCWCWGKVREYTGSSAVNCDFRTALYRQFVSLNVALGLRKDNVV